LQTLSDDPDLNLTSFFAHKLLRVAHGFRCRERRFENVGIGAAAT
jgi:hypothetical protein